MALPHFLVDSCFCRCRWIVGSEKGWSNGFVVTKADGNTSVCCAGRCAASHEKRILEVEPKSACIIGIWSSDFPKSRSPPFDFGSSKSFFESAILQTGSISCAGRGMASCETGVGKNLSCVHDLGSPLSGVGIWGSFSVTKSSRIGILTDKGCAGRRGALGGGGEQRRAQGLCFNCDEKYRAGHQCKRPCYLDGDDPEEGDISEPEEEPAVEEATLSFHAMTGLHSTNTMQVHAHIINLMAVALVDSGSTHNFISQTAAHQLGLRATQLWPLEFSGKWGEAYQYWSMFSVQFDIEAHPFVTDFLVIPLAGFDLVLGIKWLQQLGPILWDFTSLTTNFTSGQRDIILHVTHAPSRCTLQHLQKDEIERQCQQMLEQGLIQSSRSPFASPVLLVSKKDQTWRFCVDYRELNAHTVKEKFPIPVVDELLDELHGANLFTKLDLHSGYHQIRVYSPDVEKTAFCTHHGHSEFLVMPFGLSNAPSTFQALMNEHSKCSFGAPEVAYLGHVISTASIKVDSSKIQDIVDWPTPHSATALKGFLGLSGYYRKFIHDYSQLAALLMFLLKHNAFAWSETATSSFAQLKLALASALVLQLPNFEDLFVIECDASGGGIRAEEIQQTPDLLTLCQRIEQQQLDSSWAIQDGLLLYRQRIYLAATLPLLPTIIFTYHDGTHEGQQHTYFRLSGDFYWKGMKSMVADYVSTCQVCQRNKTDTLQPAGLLQPLQLPTQVWAKISMDFTEGLPKSSSKSTIQVVVDCFSKYGHFIALSHPYIAVHLAQIFMDNIVRLHRLLETITSDRDALFTSTFWKDLFRLQGTKLAFSSAYHPRLMGKQRLSTAQWRCICAALWAIIQKLGSAGLSGSNSATTLPTTPPSRWPPFMWFMILECIGSVAYRFRLPTDAHIHDVFHVSLLKPFKRDSLLLHTPLPPLCDGRILPTLAHVYQACKVNDRWELLIHWAETDPVEASWQPLAEFRELFPDFELEDKLFLQEGSDVMDSIASRVTARHRT
ncbi:uncharacterized protein [Aristolochia californica]|uniref:uncharacterized protein n=1 Tax=Aristolochia californica TaxID=171875 RepID=UPI0035E1B0FF